MIFTPDAAPVGPDTGNGFLASAGRVTIGAGTDLSDIDLTAAALDNRVRFACDSARLYWAADGTLKTAAAGVWPLEYSNGVAAGRTPPEPQATNLQLECRGTNAVNAGNSGNFFCDVGTTVVTETGPDGGGIGAVDNAYFYLYAEYNATAAAWLATATGSAPGDAWERITIPFTLTAAANVRTYNARASSTSYIYGLTATAVPAGNAVASFFRRMDGSRLISGMVQVETGSYATSPVITGNSAVTRAEAFAYVLTQNAKGMIVTYSDGTTESFTFSGEYQYPLPNPSAHWGARYITRIAYQR